MKVERKPAFGCMEVKLGAECARGVGRGGWYLVCQRMPDGPWSVMGGNLPLQCRTPSVCLKHEIGERLFCYRPWSTVISISSSSKPAARGCHA